MESRSTRRAARCAPALFAAAVVACLTLAAPAGAGFTVRSQAIEPWVPPSVFATADFDQDGLDDLVVGGAGPLRVLRAAGSHEFTDSWEAAGGDPVSDLAIGDLNGDGDPDLVTAGADGTELRLGDSGAAFAAVVPIDPHPDPSVALAEVTGDTHLDVVLAGTYGAEDHRVVAIPGIGDGTFAPASTLLSATENPFAEIEAADLDADSDEDLLIGREDGSITLLLSDGAGGFTGQPVGPGEIGDWVLGDFDGDLDPDLLTAAFDAGTERWDYELHRGQGDGTFAPAEPIGSVDAGAGADLVHGDFDVDDVDDLAIARGDAVTVLFGRAEPGSWERSEVATGGGPGAAAQLDVDDAEELVLAGSNGVITFDEDSVDPTASIDSGPAEGSATGDDTPTFVLRSDEPNSTFECTLDEEPVACDGGEFTPGQPLSEGEHSFSVVAVDPAGNRSDPLVRTFTVDVTPPDTTIDSGPAQGAVIPDDLPQFTFSSIEGGSTFECTLDDQDPVPCSGGTFIPAEPLDDGPHTFTVAATDPVGNRDPDPPSRSFTVDTVPPPLPVIESAPGSLTNDPQPQFTFGPALPGVGFRCGIDQAPTATCNSRTLTPSQPLADGPHVFRVRSIDAAGNLSEIVSRSFTVDTAAPDTSISSLPRFIADSTASVTYGSEAGATFQCRLDAGAFQPCPAAGRTYDDLAEGRHTIEVRAVDQAGNADTSPAKVEFTVDTIAPDSEVVSGPYGLTRAPRYTFDADEVASFSCRIDYGEWRPCNKSGYAPGALADGLHVFFVRATDPAGNVETDPAYRLFTLDATPPAIEYPKVPRKTFDRTPLILYDLSEPVTALRCKLDGRELRACDSPLTLPRLRPGKHKLRVVATDEAGNQGAGTIRFAVKRKRGR